MVLFGLKNILYLATALFAFTSPCNPKELIAQDKDLKSTSCSTFDPWLNASPSVHDPVEPNTPFVSSENTANSTPPEHPTPSPKPDTPSSPALAGESTAEQLPVNIPTSEEEPTAFVAEDSEIQPSTTSDTEEINTPPITQTQNIIPNQEITTLPEEAPKKTTPHLPSLFFDTIHAYWLSLKQWLTAPTPVQLPLWMRWIGISIIFLATWLFRFLTLPRTRFYAIKFCRLLCVILYYTVSRFFFFLAGVFFLSLVFYGVSTTWQHISFLLLLAFNALTFWLVFQDCKLLAMCLLYPEKKVGIKEEIISSVFSFVSKFSHIGKQVANGETRRTLGTTRTVGLFSEWGCGKTTFLRQLENELRGDPHVIPVYFDAWQNQSPASPEFSLLDALFNHPEISRIAWFEKPILLGLASWICRLKFTFKNIEICTENQYCAPRHLEYTLLARAYRHLFRLLHKNGLTLLILIDEADRCERKYFQSLLTLLPRYLNEDNCCVAMSLVMSNVRYQIFDSLEKNVSFAQQKPSVEQSDSSSSRGSNRNEEEADSLPQNILVEKRVGVVFNDDRYQPDLADMLLGAKKYFAGSPDEFIRFALSKFIEEQFFLAPDSEKNLLSKSNTQYSAFELLKKELSILGIDINDQGGEDWALNSLQGLLADPDAWGGNPRLFTGAIKTAAMLIAQALPEKGWKPDCGWPCFLRLVLGSLSLLQRNQSVLTSEPKAKLENLFTFWFIEYNSSEEQPFVIKNTDKLLLFGDDTCPFHSISENDKSVLNDFCRIFVLSINQPGLRQNSDFSSEAFIERASSLISLKRNSEAQKFLQQAEALSPTTPQTQTNLGGCFYRIKQMDKAKEWLEKAAEQGFAQAQFNLAVCCENSEGVEQDLNEAVKWYKKAAEQGNPKAQNNLALRYQKGEGVEQNLEEAVKWYKKAAEQGNPKAQFNLAQCYRNGKGVEQNLAEAVKWYTKAAEQGDVKAQFNLALRYQKGEGVENFEEAVKWYTKAAEQGLSEAQFNLALRYENGEGVEQNLEEAVKWYRKAAEQGDTDAQFNLALCYQKGEGVEQDLEEAVKWYEKAAEQGDADAQFNLAQCYRKGEGVEQDLEEAVKWYEKAAEQGDADAQFSLALRYQKGEGVEQNLEEAVKWYKKAAEQGNVNAQFNLALRYQKGEGVEKNLEEAVKWYEKAAEQGDADAQFNLAQCYRKGEGVEQDLEEAVKWYTKAAEQGLAEAQFNLALRYQKGEGVEQDLEEAVRWYKEAAAQGFQKAKDALQRLGVEE